MIELYFEARSGVDDKQICLYNKQGVYAGEISFSADAIKYHSLTGELYVDGSDIIIDYDYYDDETDQKAKKSLVDKKIVSVTIQRVQGNKLHYAV